MTREISMFSVLKAVVVAGILTGLLGCSAKARTAEGKNTEAVDTPIVKESVIDDSVARIPNSAPLMMREAERVFDVVEDMPMFPGGEKALKDYLAANVHYPKELEDSCIQGRVVVMFAVEKDGSITRAMVVRGVHPALDREALRVVNAMPKWYPGRQNGIPVCVRYTLPVTFQLKAPDSVAVTYSTQTNANFA